MIPIGSKELTTPRLLLRKFRLLDGLELFEAGTDYDYCHQTEAHS